ncbi:MAG: type II CAAX endopeptidase family protein [Pirellulales bacterium]
MQGIRRAAAVLEVLGIYAAGQMLAFLLGAIFRIPLLNPLLTLSPAPTPYELLQVTGQLLKILLLQYSGWFLLVLPIGWWRRRGGAASYGLTLSGRSLGFCLAAGVVLFAVADLPIKALEFIHSLYPLGPQVAWREALMRTNWNTVEFWLLMAVGSYALVPLVEELFFRGYCQTRLEEAWGPATAILATALLFTFSHSQYFMANLYNVSLLLTSLASATAWGYVYYRTRSLLPTIVAHSLVNMPSRNAVLGVLLVVMLIICAIAKRDILQHLRGLVDLMRGRSLGWQGSLVAVLCGLFVMAFAVLGDIVIVLGTVMFVVALALDWFEKRASAASKTAQAT